MLYPLELRAHKGERTVAAKLAAKNATAALIIANCWHYGSAAS
jgi:hypothetical protein